MTRLFSPRLTQQLPHYYRLTRMDKPIGTLLLLWPTLWGLWIAAEDVPDLHVLLVFIAGTFLMRSAGCVMNDLADRPFDGHVERTCQRPLVTGHVSANEALILAALLSLSALLLTLTLNPAVWWWALPAFFLAASYPWTKRFLAIPQAYLGIAFGFGIPMGFAAISGEAPPLAWLLLVANIFWAVAYDTEYAMVDRNDDLKIGIRSAAITFGRFDVAAIVFCYTMFLLLLAIVGISQHFKGPFFVGIGGSAILARYHYSLIRHRQREQCFKAFRHNNWIGFCLWLGLVMEYL